MDNNEKEEIFEQHTITKEEAKTVDAEVGALAMQHLIELTKEYVDNVQKLSTTYHKEFAVLGLGIHLGMYCADKPVVQYLLGEPNSIEKTLHRGLFALFKGKLKARMKAKESSNG